MKLSKKSLLSQKYTEKFVYFCCRTPRGVRGLKSHEQARRHADRRRTPQGVRGLKSQAGRHRRALRQGRTPQGVRGLKYAEAQGAPMDDGRTPQGVRGLKLLLWYKKTGTRKVAPRKGCVD